MSAKKEISRRSDGAVLSRNYGERLEEFTELDAVTHRSGKPWVAARKGVEEHGRIPLYYVERDTGGMVTHKGYISRIVIRPNEHEEDAQELRKKISEADTYSEHSDELDTTTFLATDGEELEEPFHQSELELLAGEGNIAENYSRQPAYVKQREGDFPNFH